MARAVEPLRRSPGPMAGTVTAREGMARTVEQQREQLAGAPGRRRWELWIVPGAHFDLGWCASIGETLAYGSDLIRRAIDTILGPHPEYRFTIEYALFLKHFLARYPHYRPAVLRLLD